MRIESKHLFSENISPFVKSLVMKRRAGIQLTEREERRLEKESKKMNDSTDELEDEVDLDEILKEMGYDKDDEMDISQLSKSEIKELIKVEVKKYFEETFEDPDDLEKSENNQIFINSKNLVVLIIVLFPF